LRTLSAIVIVIALAAAVSVAYVQACGSCADGSATAASGCASCAGGAEKPDSCGSCAKATANCDGDCKKKAADCDGDCATCDCPKGKAKCAKAKCADACVTVEGTVRYVRSTNKAVKVINGDKGYLLRVGGECGGCPKTMISTISGLEKGDAVIASYKTCPTSGKYYLCSLKAAGADAESTTPAPAPAPPAESTSS